ncbi:amidase [Mesorhizobium sp. Cs1299R1N1]|uniref:amidase n=1 Tax=Mesorhizobium sp. Cs1299R1N1 TaxID=3015172 RepID=UPI00301E2076
MKLSEYVHFDACELASLVKAKDVTAIELSQLAYAAFNQVNPSINAVIEFYDDFETVEAADSGHFQGVPFFRKDLGPGEAGRLQEKGSRLFRGYRSAADGAFVKLARRAGLRLMGRTATSELGMSGATETLLHGITRNPWNLALTAGGSSGGAAAAVAAGITPIAHASDGGGSIRGPAAWCGLVGLLPSRGRISSDGNEDHAGGRVRDFVICRSVRDMAAALDAFSGPQPGDAFIIVQPERPFLDELDRSTGRLRVGVARDTWGELAVAPEVMQAVDDTAALLAEMGHEITEIAPPFNFEEFVTLALSEAGAYMNGLEAAARLRGRCVGAEYLEPLNLQYLEYGRNELEVDGNALPILARQEAAVRRLRLQVAEATGAFDILLTPSQPFVAHPHGVHSLLHTESSVEEWTRRGYKGCHLPIFNITGQPAVSLPLAESVDGLPIGLQIVGRFGDEATLIRVARDLEEARPWKHRKPQLFAG